MRHPVGAPSSYYAQRAAYCKAVVNLASALVLLSIAITVCNWAGVGAPHALPWLQPLYNSRLPVLCALAGMLLAAWVRVYAKDVMAASEATITLVAARGVCGKLYRHESGLVYGCELPALHQGPCSPTVDVTAAVKEHDG